VNKDIIIHTDAAQSIGKVPVNVTDLAVDLLTIVSQKMYGPKGVGRSLH
jgi:cysteine desulfurase